MNIRSESIDKLFKTILKLENIEECYDFFGDLCTIKEIQDMAQRLDTAILLNEGLNYQTISKEVGVSTATISRVSKCLNYGNDGYKKAIERLAEDD
ncbi:MAG: YerC/YecD family TrpR-related protein [Clostridia bacterium]|nr:YerC/YecD family TrpR-related protein [Clostridia bacterium]